MLSHSPFTCWYIPTQKVTSVFNGSVSFCIVLPSDVVTTKIKYFSWTLDTKSWKLFEFIFNSQRIIELNAKTVFVPRRWFWCGSLLPVFGVRVSVMFHLMFVYYTFSSVWVAEWLTFWEIAAHSVSHLFSLYLVCLWFWLFPILVLRVGLAFWLH